MNVCSRRITVGAVALAVICSAPTAIATQTPTSRIVSPANAYLSILNDNLRQRVLFAFDHEKHWANFPTSFVPQGGTGLKIQETLPAK